MSSHQHVYVGAAVRIDSAPENAREIIEDMPGERLFQPFDGNEERVSFLLPNVDCDCGFEFTRDTDSPPPILITSAVVSVGCAKLYDAFREDLFYLSDRGFRLTVVYVAFDYWY